MTPDNGDWDLSAKPEHELRAQTFITSINQIKEKYPTVVIETHNVTSQNLGDATYFAELGLLKLAQQQEQNEAGSTKIRVIFKSDNYRQVAEAMYEVDTIAETHNAMGHLGQKAETYEDINEYQQNIEIDVSNPLYTLSASSFYSFIEQSIKEH